jgi:potassium-transporting ATPase potassium-binding subunit
MSLTGWLQFAFLGVLIAVSTPILGRYLYRVYFAPTAPGDAVFRPVEQRIFRWCGIDSSGEQRWTAYAFSLLAFSFVACVFSYLLLRFQGHLPLNPDHFDAVRPALSFNTAVSFLTGTNWQSYAGESTMSQLSQMVALVVQQFLAGAVGMAVAVAFTRSLVRRRQSTLGSFWVDVVRSITRILLPLSFVFSLAIMSQGVIQNFSGGTTVHTPAVQAVGTQTASGQVEAVTTQTIPGGPVASMTAIELLGSNGGGYFNANLAHPFQNPNPVTNVLLYWLVFMIPFAFPYTFGKAVGSMRQGWVVFMAMALLLVLSTAIAYPFEGHGNPKLVASGITQAVTATQPGGNMEGKETRFGVSATLFGSASTATTAGAPNGALESFTPAAGSTALVNMLFGEISPGGDGSGLYGMLIMVLISVFIAGLMVGRTPEYLGKKIQASEMKLIVLFILALPAAILIFTGIAITLQSAQHNLSTAGPHGLTELVYNYTSVANTNGSAFGGMNATGTWYLVTLAMGMLVGRFFTIIPVLAISGSLVRKRATRVSLGTFRTDTPLFLGLLLSITLITVGLTYFPILALGPIVEHLTGHF